MKRIEKYHWKARPESLENISLEFKEIIQTFSIVVGLTATDEPYYRFIWYCRTAYGAAIRKTVCKLSSRSYKESSIIYFNRMNVTFTQC